MRVLEQDEWEAAAQAHRERLAPLVEPHLARRRCGEKHPVHDFMFEYYSFRPAALQRWHPGYGVGLRGAPDYAGLRGYQHDEGQARVSPSFLAEQRALIDPLRRLLVATAARAPQWGCFGLHEWAMVYRSDAPRHPAPLRLGTHGTNAVVQEHPISCSHFDAFRFFTPSARPLNRLQPTRDDRLDFEQPGCLHAGMDLYKHAFRLSPLISSDLIAEAFELAWDIRIVDMRAAPYDFTGLILDPSGEEWTPVPIETPEGKAAYVQHQRNFASRGLSLRKRLIQVCDELLHEHGGTITGPRSPRVETADQAD